jgi:hypothetical protein
MIVRQLVAIELPIIQAPMAGRGGERAGRRGIERHRPAYRFRIEVVATAILD